MRHFSRVTLIILFVLALPPVCFGSVDESDKSSEGAVAAFFDDLRKDEKGTEPDLADQLPEVPCEGIEDAEVAQSCNEALLVYFEYYEWGLNHRRNVIKWHHLSSRIILFVVLGLVSLGVYFAWRQFSASLVEGGQDATSTVEVGGKGIRVSSPVLGVVILTLSLAFFYLYLVFVSPVLEII